MVFAALQLEESDAELAAEHVDLAGFAELLLSHLLLAELCGPIQIFFLLEDLECAIYAQLQAVVHAAAEHLSFCLEEGEGGPCEDVYHSFLEKGVLNWLESLKGFTVARHSEPQLALVAKAKHKHLSL